MNMVNPDGVHIGGLGGFFRSLGAMIRQINPTQVYVVFDGAGSANNRKNIMPDINQVEIYNVLLIGMLLMIRR